MAIFEIPKIKFIKTTKVNLTKEASDAILKSNPYFSKKDLGNFVSSIVLKEKDLAAKTREFVMKKYELEEITNILKTTKKATISFREIRKRLGISKRIFYPRLALIKKYFRSQTGLSWRIVRGRFERLD